MCPFQAQLANFHVTKPKRPVTQSKLDDLEAEYRLVKSRVGLAREWLEVKKGDSFDYGEEETAEEIDTSELKLPGSSSSSSSSSSKPKIEVLTSVDHPLSTSDIEAQNELDRRRARIRELEATGVDLTEEELSRVLGVPNPNFPGDLQPMLDTATADSGVVDITEHHKPDGTVETYLTPKGGASRRMIIESKSKKVMTPLIQERSMEDDSTTNDRVVMTGIMSPMKMDSEPPQSTEEAPRRVSKFKAMREQNR